VLSSCLLFLQPRFLDTARVFSTDIKDNVNNNRYSKQQEGESDKLSIINVKCQNDKCHNPDKQDKNPV
jgi:hypothetical protein